MVFAEYLCYRNTLHKLQDYIAVNSINRYHIFIHTNMTTLLNEYVKLYGKEKWAVTTYSANMGLINNYILPVIGKQPYEENGDEFGEVRWLWKNRKIFLKDVYIYDILKVRRIVI